MNILAIDTSSPSASAAIMCGGNLVGEYVINNGKTHSQVIMPMISDLLEKANMKIEDIDVFAASIGPGSFTGLRIGVATAKTFAQATGKKLIGISALDGLCANIPSVCGVNICPILDARRGNVYNAIYKDGVKIKEDRLIAVDDVIGEVEDTATVFLGDAVSKYKVQIKERMGDNAIFTGENNVIQRASSVAYLANIRAEASDFDDIYTLEPIYVRASQAERELGRQE